MTHEDRKKLRREIYERIEAHNTKKQKEEDMEFMLVLVELITGYARTNNMSVNQTLDTIAHNLQMINTMTDFDAEDEEGENGNN